MPNKVKQDIILSEGLDLRRPEELLTDKSATVLENIILDKRGVPSKLPGSSLYGSPSANPTLDMHELIIGNARNLLAIDDTGEMFNSTGDGAFASITSGLSQDNYEFATARNRAYFGNGTDVKSTDGATVRDMGLKPPAAAAVLTPQVGSGSMALGTYSYRLSFLYDNFQDSSLGPSALVTLTGSQDEVDVDWTALTIPAGVTKVRVYRTIVGGTAESSHFFAEEAIESADSLIDGNNDSGLGFPGDIDVLPLTSASSFLAGHLFSWHANRMWMVPVGTDKVFISDVFEPDKFRELNFFRFNENDGTVITAIHPFGDNLLVFKDKSVNIIRGVFNGSLLAMQPDNIINGIGCIDSRSVSTIIRAGVSQVAFADSEKMYSYTGQQFIPLTENIESLYKSLAPIATSSGNTSHVDTFDADFNAGTSSDAIIIANDEFTVSVPEKVWTTDADFNDATVGTELTVDDDKLTANTGPSATVETFFDKLEGTNGTTPAGWTNTGADDIVLQNQFLEQPETNQGVALQSGGVGSSGNMHKVSTRTLGSWHTLGHHTSNNGSMRIYFMSTGTDPEAGTGDGYAVEVVISGTNLRKWQFIKTISGIDTVLGTIVDGGIPGGQSDSIYIARDVSGNFQFFHAIQDLSETSSGGELRTLSVNDTSITTSTHMAIFMTGSNATNVVYWIKEGDTGVTTTWESGDINSKDISDWGPLVSTFNDTLSAMTYSIRTAISQVALGSAVYDVITPGTDISTLPNSLDTDQFFQVKVDFSFDELFNAEGDTPEILDIDVSWTATSTLDSEAINTGTVPTGWDTFLATGSSLSSVQFRVRSAVTQGGLSGESYVDVSPGATPAIPLRQFVQWQAVVTSTTVIQSVVQDVTVQWLTSTIDAKRMKTIFFDDLLIVTAKADATGDSNDTWILQDRFGRWTTADIEANTLVSFFGNLYYSDVSNGKVLKLDKGLFSREGVPVTSTIETGNRSWVEASLADRRKLIRAFRLSTTSTDNFSLSVNPDENGFVADVTVVEGQSVYVPINQTAIRHKIRIKHTGIDDFILWKVSPELHVYSEAKG